MKTFLLRAMALALLALVGCGGDGGSPTGPGTGAPSGTFTTDRSTYVPFRVARLELDGPAPTIGESITGTLGGVTVDLTATEDSVLLVLVPDLAAGSHVLTFTIGSRGYRGSIAVTSAPAVADPEAYLDGASEQAAATIASMRAEIAADTSAADHDAVLELLRIAEDSLAAFESGLAALSAADAAVVAQVLHTNLASLEEFEVAARTNAFPAMAANAAIPECANLHPLFEYECTWNHFVDAAVFTGGFAALSALAAKGMVWTGPIGFVVSAGSATVGILIGARALDIGLEVVLWKGAMAYKVGTEVVAASDQLFRTTFTAGSEDPLESGLLQQSLVSSASASMTRLINGRATTFSFSPRVRNVQPSDRDLPVDWLARGLELIDSYNEFVGRFTTRAQITLPAATMAWLEPVPFEQIDVEVVANDNVRLDSLGGAGDRISVRFSTDEATAQAFTYDVVYSSGVYPPVRVRYDAVLEPPSYQLTWANHSPVADTMSLHAGVYYPLVLLDEAGTPVARDWATDGITLANNTNPDVTPVWDHNGTNFSVSFELGSGQTQASTEVDVMLDRRVITHLVLELTDSLAFYRGIVTGGWTRESFYRGEELSLSEQWTLTPDGTVSTSTDREGTWSVSADFAVDQLVTDQSVPEYRLSVSVDRRFDIPLSYPLVPHEEEYWVAFNTNTWYLIVITKN